MAKFDITIEKKNLIPSIFWIAKLLLLGTLTHFMIIPLLFNTITFLGELRSVWQVLFTIIITAYLSDVIKLKFRGKDWF